MFDIRAPENLGFGPLQLIIARFSLLRAEAVPFRHSGSALPNQTIAIIESEVGRRAFANTSLFLRAGLSSALSEA
jgi:hypothetical protein